MCSSDLGGREILEQVRFLDLAPLRPFPGLRAGSAQQSDAQEAQGARGRAAQGLVGGGKQADLKPGSGPDSISNRSGDRAPYNPPMPSDLPQQDWITSLSKLREAGQVCAMVTVTGVRGSAPRDPDRKSVV